MTADLHAARLRVPTLGQHHMARPRLVEAIGVPTVPFTDLIAPAGHGKSEVVLEWLAANGDRFDVVAWVRLGSDADDPRGYVRYLVEAFRVAGLDVDELAERAREATSDSELSGVLTGVSRAVEGHAAPIVLVVDFYKQAIPLETASIVAGHLDDLPGNLRIVFMARFDPTTPGLARRRLEGKVNDIGPADLAFTEAETRRFLEAGASSTVLVPIASQIHERCAGWPAAVAACARAALGSVSSDDARDRISRLPEFDTYIREQLAMLPAEVRKTMFGLAVLGTARHEDADPLLGPGAASRLSDLARSAYVFSTGSDLGRIEYFNRPLIDHTLLEVAQRDDPDFVDELAQRAIDGCVLDRRHVDAFDLAARVGFEATARTLERYGEEMLLSGHLEATHRAIESLPPDVDARRPTLLLQLALASQHIANNDNVTAWLDRARHHAMDLEPASRAAHEASIEFATGLWSCRVGDCAGELDHFEHALELREKALAAGATLPVGFGWESVGQALLHLGRGRLASEAITRSLADPETTDRAMVRALGLLSRLEPDPATALGHARRALELARELGLRGEAAMPAHFTIVAHGEGDEVDLSMGALERAEEVRGSAVLTAMVLAARAVLRHQRGRDGTADLLAARELLVDVARPHAAEQLMWSAERVVGAADPRLALSEQELRVLLALAGRLTLREIAGELLLSHNTIKTYVKRIYTKFEVGGRSEAVEAARRRGLVDRS